MIQISEIRFIQRIRKILNQDKPIYLVGGAIRDALLDLNVTDLDFTCSEGIATGRRVADLLDLDFYILDHEHDTCRVIETLSDGSRAHYDFAGFRGKDLYEDLKGRDLSINAIAFEIFSNTVIDPLGGATAIREKRLSACSDNSIEDDPLRVLRAIRFANALKFRVDDELMAQIKANSVFLGKISRERVRDEIFKIISGPNPHLALQLMQRTEIICEIFPELIALKDQHQSTPHVHDVWNHTLGVVRYSRQIIDLSAKQYDETGSNADVYNGILVMKLGMFRKDLIEYFNREVVEDRGVSGLLMLAALFHDVEKPNTVTIQDDGRIRFLGHDALGSVRIRDRMIEYKFSGKETEKVSMVIRYHMRFHSLVSRKEAGRQISNRSIYRFFHQAEQVGVELVILGLADLRGTYEYTLSPERWRTALDVAEILLDAYFNRYTEVIEPPLLLNGFDLMNAFGMKPGQEIGKVLEYLREEQAAASIKERETAYELVKAYLERGVGI